MAGEPDRTAEDLVPPMSRIATDLETIVRWLRICAVLLAGGVALLAVIAVSLG